MHLKKILALRMWNRFARTHRKIQKLLIEKANQLHITILTINMMAAITDRSKLAVALISPEIRPMIGQFYDYALLFLELPNVNIAAGFYRLQLAEDADGQILPQGILVDESGQFVCNVQYHIYDAFAPILGTKTVPETRLTVFETFNVGKDSYAFGGTQADGQAFLIRI